MIRFDDTVAVARGVLSRHFPSGLPETTLVRDAAGSISVVLPEDALPDAELSQLAAELHGALERFSPGPQRVVLRQSDLVDAADVLESPDRVRIEGDAFFVDRLLTNQDWLRRPLLTKPPVPTASLYSIKGGVGRSTALAAWAWHLARQGRRVVVVDLDLEAPGIASMLLPALPDRGLVDWLVEALVGGEDPQLLEDSIGLSRVAEGTPGVVQVIPAFGTRTQEYVAKVGRVYLPTIGPDGRPQGLADRLSALLARVASRLEPPDAILIDSRSGLHDIAAAAVTQLGAEVFLFARDEPQTWAAYRQLFSHLRRSLAVEWGMPDDDLRWRLKTVAAQLDAGNGALASFLDNSYTTWLEGLYDSEEDQPPERPGETVRSFAREDDAPHNPLCVLFDPRIRGFSLAEPGRRPDWRIIEASFGPFLEGATGRLLPALGSDEVGDGPGR